MLAVATSISAGGVAMVVSAHIFRVLNCLKLDYSHFKFLRTQFVANMLPGLILSVSAPYWFHLVSYKARILMASVAMGFACIFVGCGGLFRDEMNYNEEGGGHSLGLLLQLFGVSLMSLASCLGEVSVCRHNCLLGRSSLFYNNSFNSCILPLLS
jgi:hypothetical protein